MERVSVPPLPQRSRRTDHGHALRPRPCRRPSLCHPPYGRDAVLQEGPHSLLPGRRRAQYGLPLPLRGPRGGDGGNSRPPAILLPGDDAQPRRRALLHRPGPDHADAVARSHRAHQLPRPLVAVCLPRSLCRLASEEHLQEHPQGLQPPHHRRQDHGAESLRPCPPGTSPHAAPPVALLFPSQDDVALPKSQRADPTSPPRSRRSTR